MGSADVGGPGRFPKKKRHKGIRAQGRESGLGGAAHLSRTEVFSSRWASSRTLTAPSSPRGCPSSRLPSPALGPSSAPALGFLCLALLFLPALPDMARMGPMPEGRSRHATPGCLPCPNPRLSKSQVPLQLPAIHGASARAHGAQALGEALSPAEAWPLWCWRGLLSLAQPSLQSSRGAEGRGSRQRRGLSSALPAGWAGVGEELPGLLLGPSLGPRSPGAGTCSPSAGGPRARPRTRGAYKARATCGKRRRWCAASAAMAPLPVLAPPPSTRAYAWHCAQLEAESTAFENLWYRLGMPCSAGGKEHWVLWVCHGGHHASWADRKAAAHDQRSRHPRLQQT